MSARRFFAWTLLVFIIAGGYRREWLPFLLHGKDAPRRPGNIIGIDRRPLRERGDPLPDELKTLLTEAQARMGFGESLALGLAPPLNGYSYAFYRSVYMLAPRRVLAPAELTPAYFARATYVLTWNLDPALTTHATVAEAGGAKLLRKAP